MIFRKKIIYKKKTYKFYPLTDYNMPAPQSVEV